MNVDNPFCQECKLHEQCEKPFVTRLGASANPDIMFILPYPEEADELNNKFQGPRAQLLMQSIAEAEAAIGQKISWDVTYLMKCPTFDNPITRKGFKEPTPEQANLCLKHLVRELKQFPNAKLMTFGALAVKTVSCGRFLKITKCAGQWTKVTLGPNEFDLLPNLDPGMANKHPSFMRDFKLNVVKIAKGNQYQGSSAVGIEEKIKICNYDEAIEEMDRAINYYKEGKIEWAIFDIENSISFVPWEGGEVITISFAHEMDSRGFAVPLVLSTEMHHWQKIDPSAMGLSPEVIIEEYGENFPHNSALATIENGFVHLPDISFDVPPIGFEITERQKAKLKVKIKEFLETIPIVGHNLKYDMKWSIWHQFCDINKVKVHADTVNIAFQWQNIGPGISNTLKDLCRKIFHVPEDWEMEIEEYLSKFRLNKDKHYGNLPAFILNRYAALDAYYNKMLYKWFLENVDPELLELANIRSKGIIPFSVCETKGMHIDDSMYKYLDTEYQVYLENKYDQICELPVFLKIMKKHRKPWEEKNSRKKKPFTERELNLKGFNLKNSEKLQELVYKSNNYNLPTMKKFRNKPSQKYPKGSFKIDKDMREHYTKHVLAPHNLEEARIKHPEQYEKIKDKYPEARHFLQWLHDYKRITKLYDDYIKQIPKNMFDGLYKPSFNLNGTTTSRLSSPFHSMPNGCDIKRLIDSRWADKGGLILAADQSQLELRIIAALSGEPEFIEAFKRGEDAHAFTASQIFGIPIEEVTKEQRGVGKTNNFAMTYGKTAYGLSGDLGITLEAAQQMLDDFYRKLHVLKEWMDEQKRAVRETGFVITKFGQRIPIPKYDSKSEYDIAEVERFAVNYPVQSAASEIVYRNVLDIWYDCFDAKLKSVFLATVHDSIEYDIFPGELFKLLGSFQKHGVDRIPEVYPWLKCPLSLSFELGTSWGGALESKIVDLGPKHVVLKAEGLSRDFRRLEHQAKRAYKIKIDKQHVTELELSSFKDDMLFRDREHWEALITLEQQ